ncbi:MAG: hypothetical protein U9Q20_05120 [Campylobacterota bacterium]|nr:hypothetical protein [Campylobacterota bacterium]
MRKAVIDQMMLWIVIFVSFIVILFLVIDYYVILKTKDRCDMLANYAVRMKALGRTDDNISSGLNSLSNGDFGTINIPDDWCTYNDSSGNYQVKVSMTSEINTITFKNSNIESYASAFNEVNSSTIDCTLELTKQ